MHRGIVDALASAALFGTSTPVAKALLGTMIPLMPAGLLYAGAGLGLAAVLAVQLARVANRAYLLVLVVIAGLLAGEALFLTGRPAAGILAALYALMLLYALAGGVFTPVFTGNHLRATGRGEQATFVRPLEAAGRWDQLKLSPQAQELPALGLSMVKPCFSMVSAKSIVAPSR